ncbi:hypothetical protein CMUS01_06021 [Colletotrichum musicola]|uniref:Uncharacterized protein n=1 Tax=Colletotrichum musicola TaxID=2175873 RepID=A0A8H6KNP2_9PEZI|nr:hypothetical protein CMUS01_06021 [Colletotrichum musicola]
MFERVEKSKSKKNATAKYPPRDGLRQELRNAQRRHEAQGTRNQAPAASQKQLDAPVQGEHEVRILAARYKVQGTSTSTPDAGTSFHPKTRRQCPVAHGLGTYALPSGDDEQPFASPRATPTLNEDPTEATQHGQWDGTQGMFPRLPRRAGKKYTSGRGPASPGLPVSETRLAEYTKTEQNQRNDATAEPMEAKMTVAGRLELQAKLKLKLGAERFFCSPLRQPAPLVEPRDYGQRPEQAGSTASVGSPPSTSSFAVHGIPIIAVNPLALALALETFQELTNVHWMPPRKSSEFLYPVARIAIIANPKLPAFHRARVSSSHSRSGAILREKGSRFDSSPFIPFTSSVCAPTRSETCWALWNRSSPRTSSRFDLSVVCRRYSVVESQAVVYSPASIVSIRKPSRPRSFQDRVRISF